MAREAQETSLDSPGGSAGCRELRGQPGKRRRAREALKGNPVLRGRFSRQSYATGRLLKAILCSERADLLKAILCSERAVLLKAILCYERAFKANPVLRGRFSRQSYATGGLLKAILCSERAVLLKAILCYEKTFKANPVLREGS